MQPVLAFFSVGLLATSVLFDAVSLGSRQAAWAAVALRDLQVGVATGLAAGILALAAVRGTLPGSRQRRLAVGRAAAQWGALGFFAVAWMGRSAAGAGTVALSTGGLALAAGAAWLTAVLEGAQGRTARTNPSARW